MSSSMKTYLVGLLHTLPFIFQIESLQPISRQDGVLQPLGQKEMEEISKELSRFKLQSKVPTPLNFMYPWYNCGAVFATLNQLPLTAPFTDMAVTLISAMYPSRYGWNLPDLSITSPIILTRETPASESHSSTEPYQYVQLNDGITIGGPDSLQVYWDKSHFPPHVQGFQYDPVTYPYGWSDGIESFCKIGRYHPLCTEPHSRTHIERDFLSYAIREPGLFKVLDEYLNIVYSNAIGKSFQWLQSSPTPVADNPLQRAALSNLYSQVDRQQGQVLHSKNGLRIIIPDEKWINWRTFSPTSQEEFTRVAWAQLTQFDKTAFMTCLSNGKLDGISTFIDFTDDATHDQFWTTELDSIRHYYIEFISHTGAFHYYNLYVIQELTYYNEPLDISLLTDWKNAEHPSFIFLPYSELTVKWDPNHQTWAYDDSDHDSPSPYSVGNHSPFDSNSGSSFLDPTDAFNERDEDLE